MSRTINKSKTHLFNQRCLLTELVYIRVQELEQDIVVVLVQELEQDMVVVVVLVLVLVLGMELVE